MGRCVCDNTLTVAAVAAAAAVGYCGCCHLSESCLVLGVPCLTGRRILRMSEQSRLTSGGTVLNPVPLEELPATPVPAPSAANGTGESKGDDVSGMTL